MSDKSLKFLVRLPNDILRGRADVYVTNQKKAEPEYSLNNLFVDALRAFLDGPVISPAQPVTAPRPQAPAPRSNITKRKGWLPELLRLKDLREVDPEEAGREEGRMFQGFKPPKGWSFLDIEHRAAHLDQVLPLADDAAGMVTIPDQTNQGITKPTPAATEKPVKTLEQLMASGEVKRGLPKPPKAEDQKPTTGTGKPGNWDGW